jgi:hypothetical protein
MEKNSDILNQINRRSGMTVPDGYFADFASRMTASLPQKAPVEAPQRSFWQKARPYVYMAAMFAGIWCMLNMFNILGGAKTDLTIDNYPGVVTALNNDNFVDQYVYPGIDDYQVIEDIYNDGTSADEIFDDDYTDDVDANGFDEAANQ